MWRWGMGIAVVVVLAAGAALAPPGVGAAPGQAGEPAIVVEQAQPLLAAYDYTVRVVGADGAPVSGAEVTGTPVGPDGSIGRITALAPLDQDGRYKGIVEMPGPGIWTVRFAVADPVANLEHVQEMVPPGQAAPSDTPEVTEPAAAEEPPPADAGPAATDTVPAEQPADVSAPADAKDDESNSAIPTLLAVGAALAILAFGTAVVVTRRRRDADVAALEEVQREDPLHTLDDVATTDDADDSEHVATADDDDTDDSDDSDKDDDGAESSDLARQ